MPENSSALNAMLTQLDTMLNSLLPDLIKNIHSRNVKAGWWTDLTTGVSILETRNRPELMMLVVSEVSEACLGMDDGLNDDKLTHLPMFDVELADVAIRLCDMIGAENSLSGFDFAYDYMAAFDTLEERFEKHTDDPSRLLLNIVNVVSAAMEAVRKQRTVLYREKLSEALVATVVVAQLRRVNLFDVIQQKLEFNANRADHKIENRKADDGKKF